MKEYLKRYLTVKELSEWVNLSKSHIYALKSKNEIPFVKIGGKLLFDSDRISEWIEKQQQTSPVIENSTPAKQVEHQVLHEALTDAQPINQNEEDDIINSPLD
jgi:excisionase family DNA binding protein